MLGPLAPMSLSAPASDTLAYLPCVWEQRAAEGPLSGFPAKMRPVPSLRGTDFPLR